VRAPATRDRSAGRPFHCRPPARPRGSGLRAPAARATASRAIRNSSTVPYRRSRSLARAARDVDQRVDVFAAGVVFYRLITGEAPFSGTPEQVMFKILTDHEPVSASVVTGDTAHAVYERSWGSSRMADASGDPRASR
jgi:serine/threonine protein kinase